MRRLLVRYLEFLHAQSFGQHTKRNYAARVRRFIHYIGTEAHSYSMLSSCSSQDCLNAQPDHILAVPHELFPLAEMYKDVLKDQGFSPMSINAHLSAIGHFFRWLGIPDRLSFCKVESQTVATVGEQERIVATVETDSPPLEKALVYMSLSGLKPIDCVRLNLGDMAPGGDGITLRVSRFRRELTVNLDRHSSLALAEWIAFRYHRVSDDEPALFINRFGDRISTSGVDSLLRNAGRKAGYALSSRHLQHLGTHPVAGPDTVSTFT
jgi:site-specific recombinase XerC